ncbi:MAG: NFACT family protein [Clostridia bacterium]|nr:NFACT family protein [Clostridia bacterium]
MAFDACMMRAVLGEFSRELPDAKIEKVLEPQSCEIDLVLKSGRRQRRLVFNVGPNAPRLQLSDVQKENPLKAPMFCMLLRKYLLGARIVGSEQLGFDRIAVFTVACYDEMGFPTTKKIICEIMGKYANLIITDSSDKVLGAMKIIDFAASTIRQVLPGLKYQIPACPDRISPIDATRAEFLSFFDSFSGERTAEKFITSTFSGISTQVAHELVFRTAGAIDVSARDIDRERFCSVFFEWQDLLLSERYEPTVVIDKEGKPVDYCYMDITYLGDSVSKKHYASLAEMFDDYYAERDRLERIRHRAKDIVTLVSNAKARTERKLAIQREALRESARGEEYKRKGDLITANIYMLSRGMTSFDTVDYYDENCPTVTVELDSRLSPSANAQRMYKLYNKAKTAKEVLTSQISLWEKELEYLDSVEGFISRAACEEDLVLLRDELYRSGYASRMKSYQPAKQLKAKPMRFVTSGGYPVLVGRNNIQNDQLTFKIAEKTDIWFHTKDIPGSHVIMQTGGEEPSAEDYTEAAAIAAYYSKATSDLVAVDYTEVKNIKKPQGSKPGFVTYKTNYTAFVKPMSGEENVNNG